MPALPAGKETVTYHQGVKERISEKTIVPETSRPTSFMSPNDDLRNKVKNTLEKLNAERRAEKKDQIPVRPTATCTPAEIGAERPLPSWRSDKFKFVSTPAVSSVLDREIKTPPPFPKQNRVRIFTLLSFRCK